MVHFQACFDANYKDIMQGLYLLEHPSFPLHEHSNPNEDKCKENKQ